MIDQDCQTASMLPKRAHVAVSHAARRLVWNHSCFSMRAISKIAVIPCW